MVLLFNSKPEHQYCVLGGIAEWLCTENSVAQPLILYNDDSDDMCGCVRKLMCHSHMEWMMMMIVMEQKDEKEQMKSTHKRAQI